MKLTDRKRNKRIKSLTKAKDIREQVVRLKLNFVNHTIKYQSSRQNEHVGQLGDIKEDEDEKKSCIEMDDLGNVVKKNGKDMKRTNCANQC